MGKTDFSFAVNDENAGQLLNIPLGYTQGASLNHCLDPFDKQRRRGHFYKPGALQAVSGIKRPIGIADQRKIQLKIFAEGFGLFGGAESDQNDADAGGVEIIFLAAQLGHLLAAKRSTEMAQKYQYDRFVLPKGF